MTSDITKERLKYIIERLLERSSETLQEQKKNTEDEFIDGKCLAYYEMLDIIRTELEVSDADLKEFGIDY